MLAAVVFGLVVALVGAVLLWWSLRVDAAEYTVGWFAYSPMSAVVSDGDTVAELDQVDGVGPLGPDPLVWVGVALVGAGAGLAGLFGGLTLARRSTSTAV